ncbi:MAG: hypothetical protein RR317_02100 [Bilophila sp.]
MSTVSRLLGPPPCIQGFLRWGLAGLTSLGAWHLHQWAPVPGLVVIGLAPFVNMFLFFRGLSFMSRTIPYCKTRLCARRLRLTPTWGSASGGYLLVDESAGLWVADGVAGRFDELSVLAYRSDGQAFRLELYTRQGANPPRYRKQRGMIQTITPRDVRDIPVASVGVDSFENLQNVAKRFHSAILSQVQTPVLLVLREEEQEEDQNVDKKQ